MVQQMLYTPATTYHVWAKLSGTRRACRGELSASSPARAAVLAYAAFGRGHYLIRLRKYGRAVLHA